MVAGSSAEFARADGQTQAGRSPFFQTA